MSKIKGLLLGLIVFACGNAATAQKWYIGPELGGNFMKVKTDTFGFDFQPTFYAGANVSYLFNAFFGLRAGLAFSQKVHSYSESSVSPLVIPGFDIPASDDIDFNIYSYSKSRISQYYLELPVMAVFCHGIFRFYAGPNASYMLFARSIEESITEVPALQVIDFSAFDPDGTVTAFLPPPYSYELIKSKSKTGLNNFDLSIRGGVGIERNNVAVNLFYNYGFFKYRNGASDERRNYHYFQATINYDFELKLKRKNK